MYKIKHILIAAVFTVGINQRCLIFFFVFVLSHISYAASNSIVLNQEDEYNIDLNSIGWAHIGMKVLVLKKAYPQSDLKVDSYPGYPIVHTLTQNGKDLFSFTTRNTAKRGRIPPEDNDIIFQIMTKNPRYSTSEKVHPGTTLEEATGIWGPLLIYFGDGKETAIFKGLPESDRHSMELLVSDQNGMNNAGIYANQEPTDGYISTPDFKPQSIIIGIVIFPK